MQSVSPEQVPVAAPLLLNRKEPSYLKHPGGAMDLVVLERMLYPIIVAATLHCHSEGSNVPLGHTPDVRRM